MGIAAHYFGAASAEEARYDRLHHLSRVRAMIEEMEVFVFTLGLTETWFDPAVNVVYGVRRKRPMWKTTPLRIGLTMLMMVTSMVSVIIVVFTGPLAERTTEILGLGRTALTVWSIAKWPVLVLLVAAMIVLLFWAAPKTHGDGRFRWVTPGSVLAVVLWLVLSTGFATYIANFASYNKTYGTVAGVIVFLIWLWLSNLAILLGLEFDVELATERVAVADAQGLG